MKNKVWYKKYIAPYLVSPVHLTGPLWTVLYMIIAISFGLALHASLGGKIPGFVAIPLILNLVCLFIFPYTRFRFRSKYYSAVDMAFIVLTLVWVCVDIWPYSKIVVILNIPYIFWISLAAYTELTPFWPFKNSWHHGGYHQEMKAEN